MKLHWEKLYSEMLVELNRCKSQGIPESVIAEACFRLSLNYWLEVKVRFIKRIMQVDSEEIEFFREVKPQFTAHIEYFLLLNQGLLFVPEKLGDKIKYWEEEALRLERFYQRHKEFIRYYQSNEKGQDVYYFLQRNNKNLYTGQEKIYNDSDCRSSHDCRVRSFLANRMYNEYVNTRLRELKEAKEA